MEFQSVGLWSQLIDSYGGLVGIAILILQVIVIVSIVAGQGSLGHKLLWTIIVLLLPVIGVILYFLLGRSAADRPLME